MTTTMMMMVVVASTTVNPVLEILWSTARSGRMLCEITLPYDHGIVVALECYAYYN